MARTGLAIVASRVQQFEIRGEDCQKYVSEATLASEAKPAHNCERAF